MTNLPTLEQRALLIRHSIMNADRLVDEARTLLLSSDASAGTAHALAVLGLEEVGKAIAIHKRTHAVDQNPIRDLANLRREINDHKAKLRHARHLVDLFVVFNQFLIDNDESAWDGPESQTRAEYDKRLVELSKSDHARKMTGFYVDIADDGSALLPDRISKDDARLACETAAWAAAVAWALLVNGPIASGRVDTATEATR